MSHGCEFQVRRRELGPLPHPELCARDGELCLVYRGQEALKSHCTTRGAQDTIEPEDWYMSRGSIVLTCILCEGHQQQLERAGLVVVSEEVHRLRQELDNLVEMEPRDSTS